MAAFLAILAAWGADVKVYEGWISGPGGSCTYDQLRSGRRVAWFPKPCTIVQLGYMDRTLRRAIYDDAGRIIGWRTVGP